MGKGLSGKWPSISFVALISRDVLCTRKKQIGISKSNGTVLTSVYINRPREGLPGSGYVPERDGLLAHLTLLSELTLCIVLYVLDTKAQAKLNYRTNYSFSFFIDGGNRTIVSS